MKTASIVVNFKYRLHLLEHYYSGFFLTESPPIPSFEEKENTDKEKRNSFLFLDFNKSKMYSRG